MLSAASCADSENHNKIGKDILCPAPPNGKKDGFSMGIRWLGMYDVSPLSKGGNCTLNK